MPDTGARAIERAVDLERIDYRDTCTAPVTAERTALEWLRAGFADAPFALRELLPPGWAALRLGLGNRYAPDRVLGWPVVHDEPDLVVLAASSPLGFDVRLMLGIEGLDLRFATAIQFTNAAGPRVWAGIAGLHRATTSYVVRHASRTAARPWH